MTTDDLKHTIMDAIRTNRVTMLSRTHFFARTGLLLAATGLVLTIGIFLVSFIHFVLRDNGLLELAQFGPPGFLLFVGELPWFGLVFAITTIVFLEILASRFSLVYKRPLVYSLVASAVVIIAGGVLLARTSLHESAFRLSHEGKLPGIGLLYKDVLHEAPQITIGTVTAISEKNSVALLIRDGSTTTVDISSKTRLPAQEIQLGDVIVVFGPYASSTIHALGIRPFDPKRVIFPRARRPEGFSDQIPPHMRTLPPHEIPERVPVYQ